MKRHPRHHDAPRLSAYLARVESRRILRMPRSEWNSMRPAKPEPVLIRVEDTPISRVALGASVIAATAEKVGSSGIEIKVYREDPRDDKPYNVDTYAVWEDLPSRPDFQAIVNEASTDFDDNMKFFLEETVFIVPKEHGSSHWLDEAQLPLVVRMLLEDREPPAAA